MEKRKYERTPTSWEDQKSGMAGWRWTLDGTTERGNSVDESPGMGGRRESLPDSC